ncbi:MAG: ribonuclease HI family protein [Candidatus Dadabacteria bacterium]|nr:ribonuclease HI family protein [Candidatus Dadabacteria bacterium]NIS07271.1 ribonuclease HI family protein [Candidatus Dadabacteria bacterium]NIY20928.1 reverse transcriptase-like protein [Candidatus Dadabacteria bacterium]
MNTPKNSDYYSIFTDGASRGNPGKSGIGVVIKDQSNNTVKEIKKYFPKLTNNQAEYKALLLSLDYLTTNDIDLPVKFFTDSQLLANQINGKWKVKHPDIAVLFKEAKALISRLSSFEISYIPREKNKEADRLANQAIDEYSIYE